MLFPLKLAYGCCHFGQLFTYAVARNERTSLRANQVHQHFSQRLIDSS